MGCNWSASQRYMAGAVVTLEPPLDELVVVGCRLMAARTNRGGALVWPHRPPAPVAAHGSYLPSYAVLTEDKKREIPALQSVDHLRRDAALYLENKCIRRYDRPS